MKAVTKYEDTLRAHNFAAVCGLLYRETLEVNYSFKIRINYSYKLNEVHRIALNFQWLSCNIADTVLTFVVLSSDVTGVQCIPRVNLYVSVFHPPKQKFCFLAFGQCCIFQRAARK